MGSPLAGRHLLLLLHKSRQPHPTRGHLAMPRGLPWAYALTSVQQHDYSTRQIGAVEQRLFVERWRVRFESAFVFLLTRSRSIILSRKRPTAIAALLPSRTSSRLADSVVPLDTRVHQLSRACRHDLRVPRPTRSSSTGRRSAMPLRRVLTANH